MYNVTFWSLVATWRGFCSNRACRGMERCLWRIEWRWVSDEGGKGREVETHHTDEPFKLLIPQNHVPVRILTYTRHRLTRRPLAHPLTTLPLSTCVIIHV